MKDLEKRVAIMQPYFLPYIGYFQLISNVDEFVVYDDIKYTKKSWINRNRIVLNGKEKMFTIPLKNGSDYCKIRERTISEEFNPSSLYETFKQSYNKSQNWTEVNPMIKRILFYEETNLFRFILNSIQEVLNFLEIDTKVTISSTLNLSPEFRGVDRVLAICKALNATEYLNPLAGESLYKESIFQNNGLKLKFLSSNLSNYCKDKSDFYPSMSILDLLCKGNPSFRKNQMLLDCKITSNNFSDPQV